MTEDRVTLRDIYKAVERVEDKMDKRIEALEKEVDDLQSFQNRALGIISVASVFFSLAATFIWNKITGHS